MSAADTPVHTGNEASSAVEQVQTPIAEEPSVGNGIRVEGTMTVARTPLPEPRQDMVLSVVMTQGTYGEDWYPSNLMGRNWSGAFELQLSREFEPPLMTFPLDAFFTDCNGLFELQFDDYNNDGDPDFTLGQYVSSNWNTYKLYTLRKDYQIEELPVEGGELIISGGSGRHSAKLEKVDAVSFRKSAYNIESGKYINSIYSWDGALFKLTAQEKQGE